MREQTIVRRTLHLEVAYWSDIAIDYMIAAAQREGWELKGWVWLDKAETKRLVVFERAKDRKIDRKVPAGWRMSA